MTGPLAAVLIPDLLGADLEPSQPVLSDTPVGLRHLYIDPQSGDEHYLVHYQITRKKLSLQARSSEDLLAI